MSSLLIMKDEKNIISVFKRWAESSIKRLEDLIYVKVLIF